MSKKKLGVPLLWLTVMSLSATAILAGCRSSEALPPTPPKVSVSVEKIGAAESPTGGSPYLVLNQRWIQGVSSQSLDLKDVDAVFWYVFSSLPDQVTVFPSENYYYFILYVEGRQIWGNIRLPAGRRDRGVLSFGYFEFREDPYRGGQTLENSKFYTQADGLQIEKKNRFTYVVRYNGKSVTFNFHQLRQDPPQRFPLGEDEVFIERTFDESGFQFFLLFNDRKNYFFWVLNEEEYVPDELVPLEEDLLVGKRSGFAFWVDKAHGDRKVFVGVRGASATRNDYYDGPFDQLADNYVEEIPISEYMVRAFPSLKGRIDKYGYYTDAEQPSRVALYTYFVYFADPSLKQFLASAKASQDPYHFIAEGSRALARGGAAVPTPIAPSP